MRRPRRREGHPDAVAHAQAAAPGVRADAAGVGAGGGPGVGRRPDRGRGAGRRRRRGGAIPEWASAAAQAEPRGTGDAALSGREALREFAGDVLVLNADHPLTDPASLRDLVAAHRAAGAAASVLTLTRTTAVGATSAASCADAAGDVERIVEVRDADAGRARAGGGQLGHLRLRQRAPVAGPGVADRRQRPGRAVPDRCRGGPARRPASACSAITTRTPRRPGRKHPGRPGRGGADPARADRARAHAGRRHHRRSGHHPSSTPR